MNKKTILIFGESKKGELNKFLFLNTLPDLAVALGEPTATGIGVHMAIQAMLSNQTVLFYKIDEEGGKLDDYLIGFKQLEKDYSSVLLAAVAIPGVSFIDIIERASLICDSHKSIILFNESDLYDFMSQNRS